MNNNKFIEMLIAMGIPGSIVDQARRCLQYETVTVRREPGVTYPRGLFRDDVRVMRRRNHAAFERLSDALNRAVTTSPKFGTEAGRSRFVDVLRLQRAICAQEKRVWHSLIRKYPCVFQDEAPGVEGDVYMRLLLQAAIVDSIMISPASGQCRVAYGAIKTERNHVKHKASFAE